MGIRAISTKSNFTLKREADIFWNNCHNTTKKIPPLLKVSRTREKNAVQIWYLIRFLSRHSSLKKKEVKGKWKRENKQVHSQLWSWVIYICCYHRIGEAVFTAGCVCCSISCLELKLQKPKVVSWNNSPKSSEGKKKGQFGCNWNWQQKVFWDIVWITTLSNSCRTALFCKQTVSEA